MIYVMSDIHGHRRRFDSVMKQINLQPEDTLYILGDVIDRNPDGIRILQQLRAMPNVVMLLGNHEYMMLDALYNIPDEEDGYADYLREKRLNLWYRNGGDVTHRYLKHIRKSVRQEILEYLDKLPVNIEIMVNGQKYLLTHAAPEDEYLNSSMKHRDGREFAVWHRYRSHDRGPDDYTVIFGHTPTTEHQLAKPATIWNGRNLIDIDCGAAYEEIDVWGIVIKTRLACLRLDDMKEFYSEEDLNEEGNQRRCADLDWTNKKSRSSLEMSDPTSRPAIAKKRDNMDEYDTIFVEFPIWWYIAPTIVNAFLESYDLTGKTIIPFATSGGSGMGKTNEALKPSCTGATLLEGKVWKSTAKKEELSVWADSLACR